jgi:hypothetical protein
MARGGFVFDKEDMSVTRTAILKNKKSADVRNLAFIAPVALVCAFCVITSAVLGVQKIPLYSLIFPIYYSNLE